MFELNTTKNKYSSPYSSIVPLGECCQHYNDDDTVEVIPPEIETRSNNSMESNKILARRLRGPIETRNGEQLRRDDAHIATKAGVAGHPSLPLSQRRGRIAATTAARTPVYRSGCASRVSIMTEGWLL
ncbi:hypothetical protein ACS0PU_002441 [Formica fusca]